MKKTTFLSTVLLLAVLAVALSTATFAWFSANNIVNVSSITFTADSSAGNGDLAIGWNEGDVDSYRLYFASPLENNDLIAPMMPERLPETGVTTLADFAADGYFTTGTQVNLAAGGAVYQYDGDPAAPYLCRSDTDYERTEFYLINKNAQLDMRVRVEYETGGTLGDRLCVALFADGLFLGVMTSAEKVSYGTITSGADVAATSSSSDIIFPSLAMTLTVPSAGSVRLTLAAWYDGVAMGDDDVNEESTLSNLKFRGEFIQ